MTAQKFFSIREKVLLVIIGLFILAGIAAASYYFGYQRNIETVKLMEREQYVKDERYQVSLGNLQAENTKTATRNSIVCAEYQKLYTAYDSLYSKHVTGGEDRYVIPGSARGQVDPCYGEVQ